MNFDSFAFHPLIKAGIESQGFITATPIQEQALPPVLEGRDVMGLAQTGTGKTAVFVLPILQRLMKKERGKIRALIIAPTRELAEQIFESIKALGFRTNVKSATIYGGVNINPQYRALKLGVDIVVACPGRLIDHIKQKTIDLSNIEVLVLDEADRMLDMGFLPSIRQILRHIPKQRQTMLFSATMPDDIRRLVRDFMYEPVTVQIGHSKPVDTVSHAIYPVPPHLKTGLLLELLKQIDKESVLIFARTKHRAKRLGRQLENSGYKACSLQGNMSQNQRQAALDGFRDGTYQILVATDIAARGIDVSTISHVINFDIPDTADAYTHRIGRTGRATKTGAAFTLVTQDDASTVRAIERVLGEKIERREVEGFNLLSPAPERKGQYAQRRPPPRYRQQRRRRR